MDDAPWPDTHLLPALRQGGSPGVVLLMTGALNPVHLGHVAMMEQARAFLRAQGMAVLCGWLSPSSDRYVQPKYRRRRQRAYTAAQRIAMCRAACAESDWLRCATWEASVVGRWPDFPEVVDALSAHISVHGPIAVAYVCGADHLRHIAQGFSHPRKWVVAVPRAGHRIPAHLGPGVQVTPPDQETAAISATRVRAALAGQEPVEPLLHPAVLHLIRQFEAQEAP